MQRQISLTKQLNRRVRFISFIAILGFLLIVFGVILASLLISYQSIQNTATSITHEFDMLLGTLASDLNTLGTVFDDLDDKANSIHTYLDQHQNIFSITHIDMEGNVIQNWRRANRTTPPEITFDKVITYEQSVIWGSVYSDKNGIPFVDLAVPIIKFDNDIASQHSGWLIAQIDLTSFWELIQHNEFNSKVHAYLLNADGKLIVYHDLKLVTAQTVTQNLKPVNRMYYKGLSQQYVIGATTPLKTIDWLLVAEQPLIEILTSSAPIFLGALLMVVIIGVLIQNFARFTHYHISVPLVIFRKRVNQFRNGDLSQRIKLPDNVGDEIHTLSQTFNHMADSIERRTSELIDANNRAQESSRLKSEFLSMVSHELRTPLNAIMGYTGILLEGMGGTLDDDANRMVTRIDNNSHRLLALINDLLDLSRIEEGKLTISVQSFNPYELAENWQEELSVIAMNKSLDLTFSLDPQLPQTLYGDPERITQIAINLINNAIKFTNKGFIKIELQSHITEWAIEVKDSGIGIASESLDYIFDEFRQGDSSSTREYEGVGLGLAIVRRLCRLMGGRIVVHSEYGKGSTFTVYLPIQTLPNTPSEPPITENNEMIEFR